MKFITRAVVGFVLLAIADFGTASAQALRWTPIAELPAYPSAIEILDDTTTLIGTFTPSLILVRGNSIVWEMRLDTTPLPYFDYPHGRIQDILPLSDSTVMVAFEYGHARSVNIVDRTTQEIQLRPINYLARSGDGTIVASARFRSTDNGNSWDSINAPNLPTSSFNTLAGGPDGNFYGTPGFSGLWRSTDGGVTWSERDALRQTSDSLTGAGPPLFVYDERTVVVYASDTRTEAGRNTALYKTTDDGLTWRSVLPIAGSVTIMYAQEDNLAFAALKAHGEGGHIYRSSDVGETWTIVDDGWPGSVISGVMDTRGGRTLAAIVGSGPYMLYRLDETSSVEASEHREEHIFSIYPNPARKGGTVHLNIDGLVSGHLVVINAHGSVVARLPVENNNSTRLSQELDVRGFAPGFYMVELRGKSARKRTKLIIAE